MPECKKNRNGGLDQYGRERFEVQSFDTTGLVGVIINTVTWTVSKLLTTMNFDLATSGSTSKASNHLPTSKLPIISSSPSTKNVTQRTQ